MAIGSTALANLLVVLIIGIVAGLFFNRYARSWLARLGTTTHSDITAALVGSWVARRVVALAWKVSPAIGLSFLFQRG